MNYDFSKHIEKRCKKCEMIFTYYETSIKFPIKCKCEGLIHSESWGFDDGMESATYYKLKCFKCNKEIEFGQPDYLYDLIDELKIFFGGDEE